MGLGLLRAACLGAIQEALVFIHSFLPPRDPNGKGLPLWPPFNHAEEYLEINLVPRVNQKPREARMQLWAEILPTKFGQWQHKQKGRKAQEEL